MDHFENEEDPFDFDLGEEEEQMSHTTEGGAQAPPLSIDENPTTPRKVFLAKKWFFTFNIGHLPESDQEELFTNMDRILLTLCDKYMAQLEIGANGNKHIQGVINLRKKARPFCPVRQNCIFPELKGAHWEVCNKWDKAVTYCCKEETFAGKRWHFGVEGSLYQFFATLHTTYIEKQYHSRGNPSSLFNLINSDNGKENFTTWSKTQTQNTIHEKSYGFGTLKEDQENQLSASQCYAYSENEL